MDALFTNEDLANWLWIAVAWLMLDVNLELLGWFWDMHLRMVYDRVLLQTCWNS